ncbi:DUF3817 domain-containing protein [Actinoplanes utahensis]|uniref:Membrane protein n=1 Tax=Actinoplanes utahensis TaxID=1869 RepID=A0A0A6UGX1_ACTUT|nr:DUF3817 domain-containing protein [Actinoplanes utahensis]KHD74303.1 membrane protein [Actinoplanes utahensis]GIF28307.1 membrane protein [Actinoplanes utahensis]
MQGALTRYRIIAWIVGMLLLVLTVGMVMKYGPPDNPVVVETVGQLHGFLYMVYLVCTFDLSRRVGWPFKRMILVMLSGTIPFLSFWAERQVTRNWVPTAEPALSE